IGTLAHSYIGGETEKLWSACRAEQEFQILNDEPAIKCSQTHFNYDPSGTAMGAVFWPVAVPIAYAIRHPSRIAIIVPSLALVLVGGLAGWKGAGRYLEHRRSRIAQKQRETEQRLKDADASLEREAPEFSESLVSS
ncbi:hypothetical protein LCGC14_3106620, partial [marine sediment metagenome]